MNSSILSGKWKEIKGEIQKTWGELTSDELDRTQGNATSLIGLVEQKFGMAKEEASKKINELLARYTGEASATAASTESKAQAYGEAKTESLSDKLNNTIESAKESVRDTKIGSGDLH